MQDNFEEIDKYRGGAKPPFVPFETAWASLQPELDKEAAKRKRKRRFLFFWFSFIAIVLIGGLVMLKNITPAAHSFTKTGVVTNTKANVPVIALPLAIGKQLIKKYYNSDKNKNEEDIVPNENRLKPAPKREVVASATASSNPKLKKTIINNDGNEVADKKADVIDENKSLAMDGPRKKESNVNVSITKNDTATAQKTDSTKADSTKANVAVTDKKKPKTEKERSVHFGLQFDLPLNSGVNSLDVNGQKEPLDLLVPTFWASVKIAKKQDLLLLVDPYSQYYLNDKSHLISNQYASTVQTGTSANNAPQQTNYTQLVAINKLISVQASLIYRYQVSNKFKIGLGLGANLLQGALLENRIVKNNLQTTHDSLYGIDKQGSEWNLLRKNFFTARLEGAYQFKKIELGASINQVVGGVTKSTTNNTPPLNASIFLRWKIR